MSNEDDKCLNCPHVACCTAEYERGRADARVEVAAEVENIVLRTLQHLHFFFTEAKPK